MSTFGKFFFVGNRGGIMAVTGGFSGAADGQDVWEPSADLLEIDGGYLVQMDLPGVEPSSVEVILEGEHLVVRGVRRAFYPSRCKRYVHMEVCRGEFGKTIALPAPIAEDKCTAVLRDGVLEIFMPFGKRQMFAVASIMIKTLG